MQGGRRGKRERERKREREEGREGREGGKEGDEGEVRDAVSEWLHGRAGWSVYRRPVGLSWLTFLKNALF